MSLLDNLIGGLFTDPPHQGHGHGRTLVEHGRTLHDPLLVEVFQANTSALGFYRSCGFVDHEEKVDEMTGLPVLWLTVQIALSDIDRIEHGPTQYVPGSHFSGRQPNNQENPEFEKQGPFSIFCKAGDIYLQDPQCWYRGAPNTSDRTRYLMQSQYAVEWAYRRFGWMNRVPVPEETLLVASDRLLGVLGLRRPEPTT